MNCNTEKLSPRFTAGSDTKKSLYSNRRRLEGGGLVQKAAITNRVLSLFCIPGN